MGQVLCQEMVIQMVIRQVPFHQGARNSCSDEGVKYKHTCNLVGKVAKADYMLVWERGGWGNSPLCRGVLREDIIKKRILSSINKNRNLPLAGGREWENPQSRSSMCKGTETQNIIT